MSPSADRLAPLHRMQEARREIQRQLDLINRQITRRMTALIPQLKPTRASYRSGRAPDPSAFLERYRSHLSAITAERQLEIDALSRKLARQDAAIAAFCTRSGLSTDRLDDLGGHAVDPCHRGRLVLRSRGP
ncbi:small-conductance mechanosensitive channel [Bradyrhizobium sp. USDA 4524]|uniref:hypothetical protein n=1 Tax=unclassified Bradyrhizobium TaxID=2631580 RepID=UPI00209E98D7|nr:MULTISPECIES: hypothetical protein [unclassified Bradyrhizobium]MCP1845773.1 small-conductance mechanosensitive channel [Bradyrhizobium sp. USDA 4538]MCP1906904.1 small-conductance mechanosensitive channel [Bradyrhizobium sp. USDA 4537]MCP1985379.1 small-conductance mechanosensitive channel [Bradyrhizobium sp. USDA 4539]